MALQLNPLGTEVVIMARVKYSSCAYSEHQDLQTRSTSRLVRAGSLMSLSDAACLSTWLTAAELVESRRNVEASILTNIILKFLWGKGYYRDISKYSGPYDGNLFRPLQRLGDHQKNN